MCPSWKINKDSGAPVIKIEKSITIEKNAANVWNTLTDISGYRSWNPVVSHAAIYGPVEPGTEIKALLGKWDFKFVIIKTKAVRELELQGGSVGLKVNLVFNISGGEDISKVHLSATMEGWISVLFTKKASNSAEETLEIFLNSLKRRVLSGGSYEVERKETVENQSESDGISMPTPFNFIYKTRRKKFRKGGSRFS